MKIYLVKGCSGYYPEDAEDWVVCAYRSEEKAKDHAAKANKRAKDIYEEMEKLLEWGDAAKKGDQFEQKHRDDDDPPYFDYSKHKNKYDPKHDVEVDTAEYYVIDIELL